MGVPFLDPRPMNAKEFFAFTAMRPDDEKWELIEGEPNMMVAFEVLSPSTADKDRRWKRKAYATLPTLSQYVVVAQDAVEVVSYDRKNDFAERRFETADAGLDLPVIGARLSLREIYRATGLL